MVFYYLLDCFMACILDLLLGDPRWLPHPVRVIGFKIKLLEKILLDGIGKYFLNSVKAFSSTITVKTFAARRFEKFAGFVLLVFVVSITVAIVWGLLYGAKLLGNTLFQNEVLFHAVNTVLIYFSLSSKSLAQEVLKVFTALDERNIFDARKALSFVVSRDTQQMSEQQIIMASIETTAENLVDGVISPLFYAVLGSLFGVGAPLVYAFKAVSTLDSMVGYKTERYLYFGYASAKTDDLANFIPARISGYLIATAAYILKFDYKNSLRIYKRDRRQHKSPNSGHPEAAFAGALNVVLGGPSNYFGEIVEKPFIGDLGKNMIKNDIQDGLKLMYMSFFLSIVLFIGFALSFWYLLKLFVRM